MKSATIRAVLIAGVAYLIIGMLSAEFAGAAASMQVRVAWRWVAWLASAAVFGAHVAYEHVRLRHSPSTTALHVALGAGAGAFGLAVAANLHSLLIGHAHSFSLLLSLVLWPILIALPTFILALVAAKAFAHVRPSV